MDGDYAEFIDGLEAHVSGVWKELNAPFKPMTRYRREHFPRTKSELRETPSLPWGTPPLPAKQYRIIVSDPAWKYSNENVEGAAAKKYPTLSVEQMSLLDVQSLNHPEGTTHFMWATMPLLADALRLMKNWGYEYKTTAFVWVKTRGVDDKGDPKLYSGLGNYTNSNIEIVLLGRSKGLMLEREDKTVKQVVIAPVGEHSAKPAEVRERIVQLYDDEPRLEMFARVAPKGWDVWGNQAPQVTP